jgi:hypothetical protein
MNRTIKEATVKRFHYDDHDQLRNSQDESLMGFAHQSPAMVDQP